MITSNEVNEIYKALILARAEIAPVAKTKSAGGRYRYATLDSLIDMLALTLPKYGLGWVQSLSVSPTCTPMLATRIIHESGQWIEDTVPLPNTKLQGGANESQELGASITYFKRYSLSAMFGIATDEDTDGVADVAERRQQVKATAKSQAVMVPPKTETVTLRKTGNEEIDRQLAEIVQREHNGQKICTDKTILWLNSRIATNKPEQVLEDATRAVEKRIQDIEAQKS